VVRTVVGASPTVVVVISSVTDVVHEAVVLAAHVVRRVIAAMAGLSGGRQRQRRHGSQRQH
jgi:hypothetical protein